ncbi:hypothetical protein A0H81_09872 [Grifola frondosa]|uniref:Uncharacterized protein n=1 Tax=Grifola frondosa TaxID=5627 RepID=A0A1C7M1F0_GRIFR|nr:hypothetical protein A0H81_09872 [Grifola frondosa]
MLTDAIRDPQVTWDSVLPQLKTDPRFTRSPLPLNQQLHLFHSHVAALRGKHLSNLHAIFLSDEFTGYELHLVTSVVDTLFATAIKLGFDINRLEQE